MCGSGPRVFAFAKCFGIFWTEREHLIPGDSFPNVAGESQLLHAFPEVLAF